MKKTLKIIWNVIQVLIIIYVILITSLLFFENNYGFSQFGDYVIYNVNKLDSKNMSTVKDGDLLIIKTKKKLKIGDIAYYYTVHNGKYIIVSDVITNIRDDRDNYLYTIGKDVSIVISSTRVIGDEISTFPLIGKILSVVESMYGFIFLVLLPIMIVFIYQVYQFLIVLRFEKVVEKAEEEKAYADDEIL